MKFLAALLLLFLSSTFCHPQTDKPGRWMVNSAPASDSPNIKAVKGFGAHLIVIRKPQEFIALWNKPEKPEFDSARVVGFNESIGIIVLFAGCTPNDLGICNSEVDYWIYKPDGTLLVERIKQKLWKEKAPPAQNTHLGSAVLGFTTNERLLVGEYKVRARVHDINAEVSFELRTQFELKK